MNLDDRGARKRKCECITILLENLPHKLCGLWLTAKEILTSLHDGCAKSILYDHAKHVVARRVQSLVQPKKL